MSSEGSHGHKWETGQEASVRFACRRSLRAMRGLMVVEHYMDLQDDTGQIDMTALRCTGCGEVVDAVILQNRVKPAPNLLYGTRQRKYAQLVEEGESDRSIGRTGNGSEETHGT